MLSFSQHLHLRPEALRDIVEQNMQNELLLPLITEKGLLQKVELKLQRVEDVEFFIRNVFKVVREPTPT
jgi:hypothetical protein